MPDSRRSETSALMRLYYDYFGQSRRVLAARARVIVWEK
jgi:hypothetical protein